MHGNVQDHFLPKSKALARSTGSRSFFLYLINLNGGQAVLSFALAFYPSACNFSETDCQTVVLGCLRDEFSVDL